MPGNTPEGARTGGWKYQAGHAFKRGQPVYLQAQGVYALATTTTGFDGFVGSTANNRFELVTGGELDALTLTPGAVYSLTSTPGVLAQSSAYPVLRALSESTGLVLAFNAGTADTPVVLPFTVSLTPIAFGVPQARADATIDPGWIPAGLYVTPLDLRAHVMAYNAHPWYVRNPEGGGILDIHEGSLVFDVIALTQVIDEAFPPQPDPAVTTP